MFSNIKRKLAYHFLNSKHISLRALGVKLGNIYQISRYLNYYDYKHEYESGGSSAYPKRPLDDLYKQVISKLVNIDTKESLESVFHSMYLSAHHEQCRAFTMSIMRDDHKEYCKDILIHELIHTYPGSGKHGDIRAKITEVFVELGNQEYKDIHPKDYDKMIVNLSKTNDIKAQETILNCFDFYTSDVQRHFKSCKDQGLDYISSFTYHASLSKDSILSFVQACVNIPGKRADELLTRALYLGPKQTPMERTWSWEERCNSLQRQIWPMVKSRIELSVDSIYWKKQVSLLDKF